MARRSEDGDPSAAPQRPKLTGVTRAVVGKDIIM